MTYTSIWDLQRVRPQRDQNRPGWTKVEIVHVNRTLSVLIDWKPKYLNGIMVLLRYLLLTVSCPNILMHFYADGRDVQCHAIFDRLSCYHSF